MAICHTDELCQVAMGRSTVSLWGTRQLCLQLDEIGWVRLRVGGGRPSKGRGRLYGNDFHDPVLIDLRRSAER